MKKEINSAKGITLIALIVTIIVILILASVGTYNGIEAVKTAQLNKFISEMKIMQIQVNNIYDKYKNGEEVLEYKDEAILNSIGKTVASSSKADSVFNSEASGITDKNGYRYFDTETINKLGIEDIKEEFFVNIAKRSIISVNGFEYNGKTYYTMDQMPSSLYNVEYQTNSEKPTFEINCELSGENKYKVTIVPKYNGNIGKWQTKYKLSEEANWKTSDNLEFEIEKAGTYQIQIQNGDINSEVQEKYLGYTTDGLMVHYDGIINTRNGSNKSQEIKEWQDLSGNRNDGVLKNSPKWVSDGDINALNFDGVDDYVLIGQHNYDSITLEVVAMNKSINSTETEYISNYESGGYGLSYDGNGKNFMQLYINNLGYKSQKAPSAIIPGRRYSLSGSFDSNQIVLFENGVKTSLTCNGEIKHAASNTALCLGANPSGNVGTGNWLNGNIYSVRIYNRALTEEEVKINYAIDEERFHVH